jgi:hypothetical protein
MSVDRLDDDDSPEMLDAPVRAPLDRTPVERSLRPTSAIEESPTRDAPDGGWQWKGLELSPHANRVAEAGLALRREAEGRDADGAYTDRGITPAMRRIEGELEHGSLVADTEKFALKSPDRFKEKLAKMIERRPGESAEELAGQIHDGIRYTFLFSCDQYTDGVKALHDRLTVSGHELIQLTNRWSGSEYRGINSRWRDHESGQFFEVQFHTSKSWEVKQATHDAYEKADDPMTPVAEVERLREYQRELTGQVEVPARCGDIQNYRKIER